MPYVDSTFVLICFLGSATDYLPINTINSQILNILPSQLNISGGGLPACQEFFTPYLKEIINVFSDSMKNVEQMIIGSPNGHSPTFKKFIKDIADSKTKYVSSVLF